MTSKKQLTPLVIVVALISVGLGVGFNLQQQASPDPAQQIPELLWPNPKQLMPFLLTDHQGGKMDLERLKGHWSLMFFGYTHCPDICPSTLQLLNSVVKLIKQADRVPSVYFISIDPERDQTQTLSDYVTYFNPNFIAASGEAAQLAYFAQQIGVLYTRVESADTQGYLMDHSSSILLIDPQARITGIFSTPHQADNIHQKYLSIREFVEAQDE